MVYVYFDFLMPFGLILCVGADVSPYQLSLQMLVCGLAIIVLDWYQQERRPRRLPRAHPAHAPIPTYTRPAHTLRRLWAAWARTDRPMVASSTSSQCEWHLWGCRRGIELV